MPWHLKVVTGSGLGVLETTAAGLPGEQGCFCAPQGCFSHEAPLRMELSAALGSLLGYFREVPRTSVRAHQDPEQAHCFFSGGTQGTSSP